MSGELMLAIGYGAILIGTGVLTWRGVRKYYDER